MKKKFASLASPASLTALLTVLGLPALAFAQAITSVQSAGQFVITMINTVAVPVLFAIAFIVFIWGVFQFFILSGSDEEKRANGRSMMLYGIVGFFLMVSVWGLVNILVGTFNFNSNPVNYPSAPYSSNY